MAFSKDIGRLNEIAVSFKYQFKSYLRTKRFIAMAIVVVLISAVVFAFEVHAGINTITAEYNNSSNFLFSFMQNLPFVVVLVAAFFGGNAIATDFSSNYSYYILVQPVRRSSLLLGRYLAAFLASFMITLIYYVFGAVSSLYFFSEISSAFLLSIGLVILFILSVMSFAFFLSSLFNNPQTSAIAVILLLIIVLPMISNVLQGLAAIEPWFLVNYGGQVVYTVFSTHFVHYSQIKAPALTKGGSFTITEYMPYVYEGVEIMLSYMIIFFTASMLIYKRKEVKG